MAGSEHLPAELIADIITRLPAKTLVRFTAVSKSWYALIKNPNFISAHFKRRYRDNDCSYVLAVKRKVCSLISDKSFTEQAAKIEIPFFTHSSDILVIGSCDGLVCIARVISCQYTRQVFIWNPSIRKFKNLGQSDLIMKKSTGDHFTDYYGSKEFVGFGFCEYANDYMVVRIVYFNDWKRLGLEIQKPQPPEVEVYSLVSDSWRKIKVTVPCLIGDESVVFCNGALHWLVASEDGSRRLTSILSFDLKNEVFRQIMLPPFPSNSLGCSKLMEFYGLLCFCTGHNFTECCVWTMKEYGDVHSWTKQLNTKIENSIASPFGFTKSGKFVFADYSNTVYWYDPDSLQSGIVVTDGQYTVNVAYKESILLLDEGNALVGVSYYAWP